MSDPGLEGLLRSPTLALEPAADLAATVRVRARRVRRRRRSAAVALTAVAVAGITSVASSLGGPGRDGLSQVAAPVPFDRPAATTPIVALTDLNGGTLYTWFEGRQWCTASKRTGPPNITCAGSLPYTPVAPFAYVREGSESLQVDADGVVAGLLGAEVDAVYAVYADGSDKHTSTVDADGFGRPVWFTPADPAIVGFEARDAGGQVVQTLSSSAETFRVDTSPAPE